eukprot:12891479-Prorocentrum_lima.AAC.1
MDVAWFLADTAPQKTAKEGVSSWLEIINDLERAPGSNANQEQDSFQRTTSMKLRFPRIWVSGGQD